LILNCDKWNWFVSELAFVTTDGCNVVAALLVTFSITYLYQRYRTGHRRRYVHCVRRVELSVRNQQYFVTILVQFIAIQRIANSGHYNNCCYFVLSHRQDSCSFLCTALFNSPVLWATRGTTVEMSLLLRPSYPLQLHCSWSR
jgi:hypothetical protein